MSEDGVKYATRVGEWMKGGGGNAGRFRVYENLSGQKMKCDKSDS